jgi:2-phospho-L-lactate transferase/gluconeogenesis factor (CofD/UPF0052 family)
LNLIVFCGGRGASSIQKSVSAIPDIHVSFVINGYDSGASTGYLRRSIPGFLGPSDFRKSLSALLATSQNTEGVARFLEQRLTLEAIRSITEQGWLSYLASNFPSVSVGQALVIENWMQSLIGSTFLTQNSSIEMAVGNLFFAAEFKSVFDFNNAIENVSTKLGLNSNYRILNVSNGEDLWLSARAGEEYITIEEEIIVGQNPPAPISDLFLLPREIYENANVGRQWERVDQSILKDIKGSHVTPKLNPILPKLIGEADAIIYSTGTRHSSLFPSYLTENLSVLLGKNSNCNKIYMSNSKRDQDIHPHQTELDLIEQHHKYMNDANTIDVVWVSEGADTDYCPEYAQHIEPSDLWNNRKIALNSLQQFSALSFHLLISKEIGFADSASTLSATGITSLLIPSYETEDKLSAALLDLRENLDNTGEAFEVTVAYHPMKQISEKMKMLYPMVNFVESSGLSRYEAISTALHASRGDNVILWCADLEYSSKDLIKISQMLKSDSTSFLMGSRNHFAISDSELRSTYKNQQLLFWVSRIGSIILASLLALRIGRFASDPLCGISAGRRNLFYKVLPLSGGAEGNIGMILNMKRKRVAFIEVGLNYRPRSKSQGKTTGIVDGLKGILMCLKVSTK